MVRGIKPKEGCMVIPPAGRENIQYIERRHMHGQFVGCACSPLKKGREANSSKKNVKPIRQGGHTADDGGEDYGFL
jgi:hypothetical protein